MAADDRDPDAPSLEPPSLFRRRSAPEPEPEPAPAPAPAPPVPLPDPVEAPAPYADEVELVAEPPKEPRAQRGPLLTGVPAAAVTGLLVGLLVVVLTAAGQRGCEAAQGTSSCGRAGYPLVLAILIVAVLAGGALLRWSLVPDPVSTSFLAVGLLAVIALLFLIDRLDSAWMLLVIPVVGLATYAGSHWVTTAVIEPARE